VSGKHPDLTDALDATGTAMKSRGGKNPCTTHAWAPRTKLHGRQTKQKWRHPWAKIEEVMGAKLTRRWNLSENEKHFGECRSYRESRLTQRENKQAAKSERELKDCPTQAGIKVGQWNSEVEKITQTPKRASFRQEQQKWTGGGNRDEG
jgi:hypothetical protein